MLRRALQKHFTFVFRVKALLDGQRKGKDPLGDVDDGASSADAAQETSTSSGIKDWPKEGWCRMTSRTVDVLQLHKSFSVAAIVRYFIVRQASDGLPCDDTRNLDESYGLYARKYVREGEISAQDDGKTLFVRMKCRATMKTNVRYSLKSAFRRSDVGEPMSLLTAECTCPAGVAPATCKHVGAMCYGMEHLCREGVFEGVTSCTDQLQHWNKPPSTRAVADMQFTKLEFGKHKQTGKRAAYDCRPESMRDLDPVEHGETFRKALEARPKLAGCCFLRLLPMQHSQAMPPTNVVLVPSTVLLSVQDLLGKVRALARDPTIFQCLKGYDPAMSDFARMFLQHLTLSQTQRHALEYRTCGQAGNPLWHTFRWG